MTIELFAFGFLLGAAIWVYQRRWLSPALRKGGAVGIVAFAAVVYFLFLAPGGGIFLGGQNWYDQSPWREIFFLLLMLFGMAGRYLAGAIEERRGLVKQLTDKGDRSPKVSLRFDPWEFSYPLLFSVVTFGGLLGQIKDDGMNMTNIILCFQTGFFWQTILKKQIGDTKPG